MLIRVTDFVLVVEAFFLGADDKYLEIELSPYVFHCFGLFLLLLSCFLIHILRSFLDFVGEPYIKYVGVTEQINSFIHPCIH